ncbi:MAG: hypothetical protein COZ32_10260 [Nitrospirae bacterium CG_4_10_14_3_um_filter_53_41]|nr:hypothetical protein [Deltaproteobacteria bacterium]PIX85087.1 MAG: hypothetical protein COZ32_10260 [Nitrospirae bacterium CG_4_10_14_3_um_filter_53_41]
MLTRELSLPRAGEEYLLGKGEASLVILLFLLVLSLYSMNLSRSAITPDSAGYPLVSEQLLPGWMDGKPAYIWMGKLVFEGWNFFSRSRETLLKTFAFYSALFGAMAAINVYFIFRALFARRYLGGMVSLLLAFSPMFFYSAVTIEVYMFNIFWVTLTVLFWLRRRFILWGVAWGLSLSSHITSLFLFFPFAFSLLSSHDRIEWKRILLGSCVTFIILVAAYGWVLSFYSSIPAFIEFYGSISRNEYLRYPTPSWLVQSLKGFKEISAIYFVFSLGVIVCVRKQWRKALPALILFPLVILYFNFYRHNIFLLCKSCGYLLTFLCLAAAFLLYARKEKRKQLYFLLLWLFPYVVLFLGWIQDGGQFYLYLVPAMSLITGGLFDELLRRNGLTMRDGSHGSPRSLMRSRIYLAVVVFLLTLLGGLYQKVATIRWYHNYLSPSDQYALQIKDKIPSKSVVGAGWMNPIIRFYAPGLQTLGFPFLGIPLDLFDFQFMSTIQQSLKAGRNVFVTKEWLSQRNDVKTKLSRKKIERNFILIKINDDIYQVVAREQVSH